MAESTKDEKRRRLLQDLRALEQASRGELPLAAPVQFSQLPDADQHGLARRMLDPLQLGLPFIPGLLGPPPTLLPMDFASGGDAPGGTRVQAKEEGVHAAAAVPPSFLEQAAYASPVFTALTQSYPTFGGSDEQRLARRR